MKLRLPVLLLLALVGAAAVAAQEDAGEDAAVAEDSSSEESSAAAESAEESSDEQTASRSVNSVPNVGGGKVTLVSNRNTLTHIASAPKVINHYAIEEQERKTTAEATLKRKDEAGVKKKQEQQEKAVKKKEQDEKNALEQKQKEAVAEQAAKKLQEAKQKAEIKLAKQRAESAAKLAKTKEAAAKEAAKRKAAAAAKAKKAAEQRQKKGRHRRWGGRNYYTRYGRHGHIRLHGYRAYHHSYDYPRALKWSRYCMLNGLITGHPSLVGWLPGHCRPHHGRLIFSAFRGRETRTDVLPDGRIYYITGRSAAWLSLNGITFDTHRTMGLHLVWGWRNYAHGYRYTTQTYIGGLCAVSGLVRHGRWGYTAYVYHACRPYRRLIFSANNHHHVSRMDVLSNRYVVYSGGYHNHHWVSLDGMIYAPGWGGNYMSLYNGWRHYYGSYRRARYIRRGPVCVLSGLIRGHWSHHISTLPRGCRPRRRLIFGANTHSHNARIDILPNGAVVYVNRGSGHRWVSLSGIHFIAYH